MHRVNFKNELTCWVNPGGGGGINPGEILTGIDFAGYFISIFVEEREVGKCNVENRPGNVCM